MLTEIRVLVILLSLGHVHEGRAKASERSLPKIQIAFLLDVSGSMDGLLVQAKSQIWRIVNTLSRAEKNHVKPKVELALITYGNSGSVENNFLKLHNPFTNDFDTVSENLFNLNADGALEYCGAAITLALDSLLWDKNNKSLRIMFIAGNESFNQGEIGYTICCKKAAKKGIYLNTIYCGPRDSGIALFWDQAAHLGNGEFENINKDSFAKYDETIWDRKVHYFNTEFNKTYLPYGENGQKSMTKCLKLDQQAKLCGGQFYRERLAYKLSANYTLESWDLVAAYQKDSLILQKLTQNRLPDTMQYMSMQAKLHFIQHRIYQRTLCAEGIKLYNDKASEYLEILYGESTPSLDQVILNMVKKQAVARGFIVE